MGAMNPLVYSQRINSVPEKLQNTELMYQKFLMHQEIDKYSTVY